MDLVYSENKTKGENPFLTNVLIDLSRIEGDLHKCGFDRIFIENSPYSNSCYLTMNSHKDNDCVSSATIRISDHYLPDGIPAHIFQDIESKDGRFFITTSRMKYILKKSRF